MIILFDRLLLVGLYVIIAISALRLGVMAFHFVKKKLDANKMERCMATANCKTSMTGSGIVTRSSSVKLVGQSKLRSAFIIRKRPGVYCLMLVDYTVFSSRRDNPYPRGCLRIFAATPERIAAAETWVVNQYEFGGGFPRWHNSRIHMNIDESGNICWGDAVTEASGYLRSHNTAALAALAVAFLDSRGINPIEEIMRR